MLILERLVTGWIRLKTRPSRQLNRSHGSNEGGCISRPLIIERLRSLVTDSLKTPQPGSPEYWHMIATERYSSPRNFSQPEKILTLADLGSSPSAIKLNQQLSQLTTSQGSYDQALALFNEAIENGIEPDVHTYRYLKGWMEPLMSSVYDEAYNIAAAESDTFESQLKPNMDAITKLCKVSIQANEFEALERIMSTCLSDGLVFDLVTLESFFEAAKHFNQIQWALDLLQKFHEKELVSQEMVQALTKYYQPGQEETQSISSHTTKE